MHHGRHPDPPGRLPFGSHSLQWHDIDLPGSAAGALAFAVLKRAAAAWIQAVADVDDADLDLDKTPPATGPAAPPGAAFAETLWWTNRELIAADAEISLLRDLHRPG